MKALMILILLGAYTPLMAKTYEGVDLREGKAVKLNPTKKYTVAYFLSSKCPCSQAHFDHINGLQKKHQNVQFVAFHSNKKVDMENAKKYISKFSIDYPVLHDQNLKYANQLKAVKTPHVFIMDEKGEVIFQGGATNSRNPKRASKFYLKDALEDISNNKKIRVSNAKTLGCYIRR